MVSLDLFVTVHDCVLPLQLHVAVEGLQSFRKAHD